jgi:toxin ParE1/3/4
MMRLSWSALAEADLAEIDDYWWVRDRDMAIALIERVRLAAERLRDMPAKGTFIDGGAVRKWSVPKSPYLLLYRVQPDGIEILRIYHSRQDWRPE